MVLARTLFQSLMKNQLTLHQTTQRKNAETLLRLAPVISGINAIMPIQGPRTQLLHNYSIASLHRYLLKKNAELLPRLVLVVSGTSVISLTQGLRTQILHLSAILSLHNSLLKKSAKTLLRPVLVVLELLAILLILKKQPAISTTDYQLHFKDI
jgi:hypothetical protein